MLSLKARHAIIRRRVKYGWSVTKICSHFNINHDTFYYHWNNYQQHGWEGLEIGSRKPDTIHCTPKDIADRILELRRSTSRSEYAIASYLEREGISGSHSTVYRILERNGRMDLVEGT